MRKNLKIVLITLFYAAILSIVIFGLKLCSIAEDGSEISILSDRISLNAEEIRSLFFCKKKAEEKNPQKDQEYRKGVHDLTANYEFQIKAGYCPADRNLAKNIDSKRLELCQKIKNDVYEMTDKSNRFHNTNKNPVAEFMRYVEEGLCPESMIDVSEKTEADKAMTEIRKINKMDETGKKILMLHVCKIKAGLIAPQPGEIAQGDESTYEDYVEWGRCPKKTELGEIDDQLGQLCKTIKESFDSLGNKKEMEGRYNLYVDGNCKI